jgi:hypothetical protein
MDEMISGLIKWLGDNPAFFTLAIGFVIGYLVGKR